VELIVSIIALVQGKILIVQASLLGSMLSNLLLVHGMCFFFGGLKHKEQQFNPTVCLSFQETDYETAQTASSLLALAISSLLIPAAFRAALGTTIVSDNGVLQISRGTSVILLVVYAMFITIAYVKLTIRYLYFQLKSHSYLYEEIGIEETMAALEYASITPWWAAGLYVQKYENIDPRLVVQLSW